MKKTKKSKHLVLSIYPTPRGYAFALFESALSPHDWGTKDLKKDVGSVKTIQSIKELLMRYRPETLVIDGFADHNPKTSARRKRIYKAATGFAESMSIDVVVIPLRKVKSAFAQFGATTKHDIATVIGSKIEAFSSRMPKVRAAWQAEDHRMSLFDAASRALTYYYTVEQQAI